MATRKRRGINTRKTIYKRNIQGGVINAAQIKRDHRKKQEKWMRNNQLQEPIIIDNGILSWYFSEYRRNSWIPLEPKFLVDGNKYQTETKCSLSTLAILGIVNITDMLGRSRRMVNGNPKSGRSIDYIRTAYPRIKIMEIDMDKRYIDSFISILEDNTAFILEMDGTHKAEFDKPIKEQKQRLSHSCVAFKNNDKLFIYEHQQAWVNTPIIEFDKFFAEESSNYPDIHFYTFRMVGDDYESDTDDAPASSTPIKGCVIS